MPVSSLLLPRASALGLDTRVMRPYLKVFDAAVAAFASGTLMTPREILDRRDDYDPRTETGTVPGADNDYTALLDHGILKQTEFSVKDVTADEDLVVIPYGQPPGPGEVAVLFDLGLLVLHSSRDGHDLSVPYTPLGTPITSELLNWLMAELLATQSGVAGPTGTFRDSFTIDDDGYTGGVQDEFEGPFAFASIPTLKFGNQLQRTQPEEGDPEDSAFVATLRWNGALGRFEFDRGLYAPSFSGTSASFSSSVGVGGALSVTGGLAANGGATLTGALAFNPAGAIVHTQQTVGTSATSWYKAKDSGGALTNPTQVGSIHDANQFAGGAVAGDGFLRAPVNRTLHLGTADDTTWLRISSGSAKLDGAALQVPGVKPMVQTKTGDFTADATAAVYLCNGTMTITLPAPGAAGANMHWTIKNIGTGTLTIDPAGSVTIDGAATHVMATQYQSIGIVSDGTNYFIVD